MIKNTTIRIKILRDIKTDALLIYIRTTLEDLLNNVKRNTYKINLGFEEFNDDIIKNIHFLDKNLKKYIINANELKFLIKDKQKTCSANKLPPEDESLIYYFNNIVKEIELNLKDGDLWIPEQVIFSLLSEWFLENEKATDFYPFVKEIDYTKILGYYEMARNCEEQDLFKEKIFKMYSISTRVIKKLKNSKYRINTSRKSKKRVTKR